MVINSVQIDTKTNLLVCSTDTGITLYSFAANEISKVNEYKILEGCRLCRLIKSNKTGSNIMNAIYLPKTSETELCTVELILPSYINNHNNTDINDNVNIYNYHNKTPVSENYVKSRVDLKQTIYNVYMTQDNIIVVHSKQIIILGKSTYNLIYTIPTYLNVPNGMLLISNKEELQLYTLGTRCGEVVIVSPNINDCFSIKCHAHDIYCMTSDINERYLATASSNGTIINVFDLMLGEKIFQFRRGTYSAVIFDLAISDDLLWLACCSYSSKGTLHIFKLDLNSNQQNKKKVENKKTFLNSMLSNYTTAYFAKDSYINDTWSARQYDLNSNAYHTCKFDRQGILHVASIDGRYFKVHTPENEYQYMSEPKNLCIVG